MWAIDLRPGEHGLPVYVFHVHLKENSNETVTASFLLLLVRHLLLEAWHLFLLASCYELTQEGKVPLKILILCLVTVECVQPGCIATLCKLKETVPQAQAGSRGTFVALGLASTSGDFEHTFGVCWNIEIEQCNPNHFALYFAVLPKSSFKSSPADVFWATGGRPLASQVSRICCIVKISHIINARHCVM